MKRPIRAAPDDNRITVRLPRVHVEALAAIAATRVDETKKRKSRTKVMNLGLATLIREAVEGYFNLPRVDEESVRSDSEAVVG